MRLSARSALEDLVLSHQMLEDETCPKRFKIIWVAAVSICRSIGHVLQKVDTPRLPALQSAIKLQWEEIVRDPGSNVIFHEFINPERNNILKEYTFGISDFAPILLAGHTAESVDDCIFVPLDGGTYAMQDCRDVLAEAIEWWNGRLQTLERASFEAAQANYTT